MDVLKPGMPSAVHVTRGVSYLVIQNIVTNAVTVMSFAILARLISPKEMSNSRITSSPGDDGNVYVGRVGMSSR